MDSSALQQNLIVYIIKNDVQKESLPHLKKVFIKWTSEGHAANSNYQNDPLRLSSQANKLMFYFSFCNKNVH